MSDQEKEIVDLLAQAWNLFMQLPLEHPMDNLEFAKAIHDAQYRIMARPERRKMGR